MVRRSSSPLATPWGRLALTSLTHGHPVTVVTDPDMEPAMGRLLVALSTQVDQVAERRR
ncbi:hypothetical protein ACFCWG_29190 [Streptomyces sp. NPDC056390]|uniref:hypothetical protein n=1 Tax=Streptomyces sp. NPDC056390 TaxID=3345806 RepID=UPI0035DF0D1D